MLKGKQLAISRPRPRKMPKPIPKIAKVLEQAELLLKDTTPVFSQKALRTQGWPDWVEVLQPEQIAMEVRESNAAFRSSSKERAAVGFLRQEPLEWLHYWYGQITQEAAVASQVLRETLGINCIWADARKAINVPGGRMSALLLWQFRAQRYLNRQEIAETLNEMNRRLDYTDYFFYTKEPTRVYS